MSFFDVKLLDKHAYFGMRDESIPYKHLRETWESWMNTTKISCENFDIAIEVVRSHGPLRVLRLVRTSKCEGNIYRTVPLYSIFKRHVLVPDIYQACKNGFYVTQNDVNHYAVPENVAGAIMAYAERTADEGYKFHELATYASGLRRRIVVGTTQFQDPWDVHPEEYHRIVISLFVLGAIARSDRTRTISACFNELKNHFHEIPILSRAWRKFINRLHAKLRNWQHEKDIGEIVQSDVYEDQVGFYIDGFRILPIRDYNISRTEIVKTTSPTVPPELEKLRENVFPNFTWALGLDHPTPAVPFAPPLQPSAPPKPITYTPVKPKGLIVERVARAEACGVIAMPLVVTTLSDEAIAMGLTLPTAPAKTTIAAMVPPPTTPQTPTPTVAISAVQAPVGLTTSVINNPVLKVQNASGAAPTSGPPSIDNNVATTLVFHNSSAVTTQVPKTKPAADNRVVPKTSHKNGTPCSIAPKLLTIPEVDVNVNPGIPRRFLSGHCAMKAMHEALTRASLTKSTIDAWLTQCEDVLSLAATTGKYDFNQDQVDKYIKTGDYQGSDISAVVLELLAEIYNLKVHVHLATGTNVISSGRHSIHIYWSGNHYSSRVSGGAVDKFKSFFAHIPQGSTILDVSASPGYFTKMATERGYQLFSAHYKEGSPHTVYEPDFKYSHHSQLWAHLRASKKKFDVVFIDAARDCDSESLLTDIYKSSVEFVKQGGSIITKTFGNPHYLWADDKFEDIKLIHVSGTCSERYFQCHTFMGQGQKRFFTYYDRPGWNRKITEHTLPYTDNIRFAREFFCDKMSTFKPKTWNINGVFSISALTGYASASKTTEAMQTYPKAVFIAPSKELSLKHQKGGVASYTPHTFFSSDHKQSDTIIVDECFQFPVDYFSLLKTCYPNHRIVALGDVHQTPYVNFNGNRCLKTLENYGVGNNICDVYKVPLDVTDALNRKHSMNIRSHSSVTKAFAFCRESIEKFSGTKIKVICFNGESAAKLRAKGINASTITTYTGSRDAVVVFYVDSASVMSQLANRPKYIYTAVTRAERQLVVTGDFDYIAKYYNIHGSNMMTFEEISNVYNFHQVILPNESEMPVTVATGLAKGTTTQHHAETILKGTLSPANDPDCLNIGVAKLDIAPVECGTLSAPTDALRPSGKTTPCYRLTSNRFAKHQLSNNNLEAVQTLVKRYARGYPAKRDPRSDAYTTQELMGGLCKALYGNEHSVRRLKRDLHVSPEFLAQRQGEYMEALQLKINTNPAAYEDLKKPFEIGRERLGFFNKRQTKFDPKEGFDTSDKVGQGVAATSKRINVLFCGYARGLLDRMREVLRNNNRDVILATHDSDAGLNATCTSLFQKHPNATNFTCNDFSEWDASWRGCFTEFTCTLLRYMGCPKPLVEDYKLFRDDWIMTYMTAFGNVTLSGREKQFSGNPFTICENTLGNMALCFSIFEVRDMQYAMFKGDDSVIACRSCVLSHKANDILGYTGHKLKLHNSPIGEFAGWFLTDEGLFPDVYRYAAKFLDKMYRDEEHFKEVVMSLQERCAAVRNEAQLRVGASVCAAYYSQVFGNGKVSVEDAISLFYFIKDSRNVKFSTLTLHNMESLQL